MKMTIVGSFLLSSIALPSSRSLIHQNRQVPLPTQSLHVLAKQLREDEPRRTPKYRPDYDDKDGFTDLVKNPKQLGVVLFALGSLLTFVGIVLFFEGNLLRLGNICLLSSVLLLFGPKNVTAFFSKKSRLQAGIITGLGVLLLLSGRPRIGLLVEIFGLLNLFGNMFPLLLSVGRGLPIIGDVIASIENALPKKRSYVDEEEEEEDFDGRHRRRTRHSSRSHFPEL